MIHISHSLLCLLARDICFKNEQIRRLRGRMISFFHEIRTIRFKRRFNKKAHRPFDRWALQGTRQLPTFPQPRSCSSIGPGGLNFRVRDGNGCGPSGKVTGNFFMNCNTKRTKQHFFALPLTYDTPQYLLDHVYQK